METTKKKVLIVHQNSKIIIEVKILEYVGRFKLCWFGSDPLFLTLIPIQAMLNCHNLRHMKRTKKKSLIVHQNTRTILELNVPSDAVLGQM